MNVKGFIFFFAMTAVTSGAAKAQQVSESWIRTAGELCQGRFSADISAQGELQISKWFSLVDPGAEGEASLALTDLNRLLSEFSGESKDIALSSYYKCLEGFLVAATGSRSVQPGELTLSPGIIPAGINVVPNNKQFIMRPMDSVGILSLDTILTFIGKSGKAIYRPEFRITSTLEDKQGTFELSQG
jgi:hypothetical protein